MRIHVLTWLVLVGALFGVAQADEDAKTVFEHGTALFALHKFGEAAVANCAAFAAACP